MPDAETKKSINDIIESMLELDAAHLDPVESKLRARFIRALIKSRDEEPEPLILEVTDEADDDNAADHVAPLAPLRRARERNHEIERRKACLKLT